MFSSRYYPYIADNGTTYAIYRDESNTEMVSSAANAKNIVSGTLGLPKGWDARNVVVQNAAGQQKTCYVLTQAEYATIVTGQSFVGTVESGVAAGTSWVCVRKNPETQRRQPVTIDTGLNDGDQP